MAVPTDPVYGPEKGDADEKESRVEGRWAREIGGSCEAGLAAVDVADDFRSAGDEGGAFRLGPAERSVGDAGGLRRGGREGGGSEGSPSGQPGSEPLGVGADGVSLCGAHGDSEASEGSRRGWS